MCARARPESGATLAPEPKCPFRQEGPCGLSQGKNCSRSTRAFRQREAVSFEHASTTQRPAFSPVVVASKNGPRLRVPRRKIMSEPNPPIPTSTPEYYHALPAPVGRPPRERYWLHALLLVATCFTTLVVGGRMEFNFLANLSPF